MRTHVVSSCLVTAQRSSTKQLLSVLSLSQGRDVPHLGMAPMRHRNLAMAMELQSEASSEKAFFS